MRISRWVTEPRIRRFSPEWPRVEATTRSTPFSSTIRAISAAGCPIPISGSQLIPSSPGMRASWASASSWMRPCCPAGSIWNSP